jgi:Predicted membrane protein (DUF2079)
LFAAFAFLPLLSRQPLVAMLPIIFVLGTSASAHMRSYNTYYSSPLLPFLFWGVLEGGRTLARFVPGESVRRGVVGAVLLVAPLIGGDYMKFPEPNLVAKRALSQIVATTDLAGQRICAQTILFPHLPYEWPLEAFSEECLSQPNTLVLLNPTLSSYPHEPQDLDNILRRVPPVRVVQHNAGFVVIVP